MHLGKGTAPFGATCTVFKERQMRGERGGMGNGVREETRQDDTESLSCWKALGSDYE